MERSTKDIDLFVRVKDSLVAQADQMESGFGVENTKWKRRGESG